MFSFKMLNFLLALLSMSKIIWCEEIGKQPVLVADQDDVGCQHKSTKGRDYRGGANTTLTGIPCKDWSDAQSLAHQ